MTSEMYRDPKKLVEESRGRLLGFGNSTLRSTFEEKE